MPARSIDSLKRLTRRFLAVPREYKYFCRAFAGQPSLPATILRIYVYETQVNDQYLDLSEVDLGERMDWEWGERRIAAARQFLILSGLLRQEPPQNGRRARVAVNCELLDKEESALPEDWEDELLQRVRPSAHLCRPKPAQKSTGAIRVPVQKGTGTGAERNRCSAETGAEMHRSRDVSLTIQKATEEEEEELARQAPVEKGVENKSSAEAEHLLFVRDEVRKGVCGRTIRGLVADEGTVGNLTKHLARLRLEERRMAWLEIYASYRHASSWGLPVSIAQRYACGDGRADEVADVQLGSENCVASTPRVIRGYRDMFAAEEEVLRRKAAMSQVSYQTEAALHG